MSHPDVTLPWEEWRKLQDRAEFAEDRLRIIRLAVHIHRKRSVGWNPWRLRRWVIAVRWALSPNQDADPEP